MTERLNHRFQIKGSFSGNDAKRAWHYAQHRASELDQKAKDFWNFKEYSASLELASEELRKVCMVLEGVAP